MTQATVQSPWIGNGTRLNPYRPKFHDDFHGTPWTDTTGTPVATIRQGGATTTLKVTAAKATIDAIKAHPTYSGKVTDIQAQQDK